jgi:hypothetical protein
MKKNHPAISNERSDVQMANIIAQFVDMKQEDIFQVLSHRRKELRKYAPTLYALL